MSSIITRSYDADLELQAFSAADKGAARYARPLARPVSACAQAICFVVLCQQKCFFKHAQAGNAASAYQHCLLAGHQAHRSPSGLHGLPGRIELHLLLHAAHSLFGTASASSQAKRAVRAH